jgi:hypothetical protein
VIRDSADERYDGGSTAHDVTPPGHGLPAPTIWPAAVAAGLALLAASVATSYLVALGGLILLVQGIWGWVRDLLGEEMLQDERSATSGGERVVKQPGAEE